MKFTCENESPSVPLAHIACLQRIVYHSHSYYLRLFDAICNARYTLYGKHNGVCALSNRENFQPGNFLDRWDSNPPRPDCKSDAFMH